MDSDRDPVQALNMWHRTIIEGVRRESPDLTTRQMAILLEVYLTPAPHTVRGLANSLKISKPAVTRALDKLEGLEMIRRKPDEDDRRSILIQRTVRGSVHLREFGELIAAAATEFL